MKNVLHLFLIFILLLLFPYTVQANVDVDPSENFGDVELGSSSSAIITIQNVGFEPITIDFITLEPTGTDFAITSNPEGTVLGSGESADVEVVFSPTELGPATAILAIDWTNGSAGTAYVALEGVGVDTSGEPVTIDDIIDFFDAGVEAGTIEGRGHRPRIKRARLRAMRCLLEAAGYLLEGGHNDLACITLRRAYKRSDGQSRPQDFVVGDDVPELNAMILQLMADLGCSI